MGYFTFQIHVSDSVSKRWCHSQSLVRMGPHCVWLILTGGVKKFGVHVTDHNATMLVEIGKYLLNK